jgi:hypothetical protein
MRTKLFRIALALIVALVCLSIGYSIGYDRGQTTTVRDKDRASLSTYLTLYELQRQGDTNRLNSWLRDMAFSSYKDCEKEFGGDFLQYLGHHSLMVGQGRTNFEVFDPATIVQQVSEEIRTNRGPNNALEPTATGH